MKLDLRIDTVAKSIDLQKKVIQVKKRKGGQESIEFDTLILCMGAVPARPQITGIDKHGVYSLRSIEDGRNILEWIKKGARPTETVEQLLKKGGVFSKETTEI